jgi:hypothetical protein
MKGTTYMVTELCDKPPSAVCAHSTTKAVGMPEGSRHYARLECAECGAFLRFLPKPENIAIWKRNEVKLAQLQEHPGLDAWSREFVNSLAQKGNGKLTPKQQVAFNDLCATYLKDNANTTKRSGAAGANGHAAQ